MIDAWVSDFLLAFKKAYLKSCLPKELHAGLKVLFLVKMLSSDDLAHGLNAHKASEQENLLPL